MARENQTTFAAQEPLLESRAALPVNPEETEKKPWFKRKKVWIVIAGLLVVLIGVMAMMPRNGMPLLPPEEEVEETSEPQNLGPFEERIQTLKIDLKEADPAKQDLTFPPVNLELELEPPPKD